VGFVFQTMELLVLSKLKWDLTAVTAYDYLDYLMDLLVDPDKSRKCQRRHPALLKTASSDLIRCAKVVQKCRMTKCTHKFKLEASKCSHP
jgi:hypothetical protein